MFSDSHFKVLDLSSFDTSKVTIMAFMFSHVEELESINLSNFNTKNVINMNYMFNVTKKLDVIDISSFETPKLEWALGMFNSSNVKTIYVSDKWTSENINDDLWMFSGAENIVGGAGTTYDSSKTKKEYARVDDPTNGKPGYFTLKTT